MRRVPFRAALAAAVAGALVAAGSTSGATIAAATTSTAAAAAVPMSAPAAGTYQPVGPIRVLDTGAGNGAPKALVAPQATVTFQVSGRGDVPASGAVAVVLNLTVASATHGGYITAYPAGGARPTTSSLNFTAGRTVPNLVVVRLGTGGKVSLYNASLGTDRLVADVSGYYTAGTPTEPGAFASLAPARILDTGAGNGAPKAPVAAGQALTIHVTGRGNVPATGVSAVVVNLTAATPARSGYITAYPAGTTRPKTSSLNYIATRTVANSVVVRLGTGGEISLYNASLGSVRLVVDVSGYFLSGTTAQPGTFTALNPSRVLDTGVGTGAPKGAVQPGDTATFTLANHGGVPASGVSAVVLNVTVASEQSSGYITVGPGDGVLPRTSNLNFQAATNVANLVVVRLRPDGLVSLRNSSTGSVRLVADVAGYYRARPGALTWGAAIADSPVDAGLAGEIACPTSTFCAAIVSTGQVATSDGATWSAPTTIDDGVVLSSISCPSATFCVAVGGKDAIVFNGSTWSAPATIDVGGGLTGVSCASSTRCVAVDSVDSAAFTTTGRAFLYDSGVWGSTPLHATGLTALSCPTTTFCGAGDDDGDFLTFNGTAWTVAGSEVLGFDGASSLSCTSSTFCAAVDNDPVSVRTFNGTTWSTPHSIATDSLGQLDCVSPTFCEVTTSDIGVSTFTGASWSAPTTVMPPGSAFDVSISCASTTYCEVLSNDGYGSTGHDTTWSAVQDVDPTTGNAIDFSCATATSCLAVTDAGFGVPFNGTAWGPGVPLLPRHDLSAVSCPTTTFCLAANEDGEAVTYDGSTVSAVADDHVGGSGLAEVSCATPTFCVAVGGPNSATFNGATWSTAVTIPLPFPAVSCPATNVCVAVSGHSSSTFNGTSWSAVRAIGTGDSFSTVTCATATFCLATGEPDFNALGGAPGGEDYATYNGSTWSGPLSADSGGWVSDVSCASSTFCAGTELDGTAATWDGSVWSDPQILDRASEGDGALVRCPVVGTCVVLGLGGTYVGTA